MFSRVTSIRLKYLSIFIKVLEYLYLVFPFKFLEEVVTHFIFKTADRNVQNLHIFSKLFNYGPFKNES